MNSRAARARCDVVKTVWVYVDTSKAAGDVDHLKVFDSADAANRWFAEHDTDGTAFDYPVIR